MDRSMDGNPQKKSGPTATAADMAWLEVEVVELKLRELIIVAEDAVGDLRRARGIRDRFVKDQERRQAATDATDRQEKAEFVNPVSPEEGQVDGRGDDEADLRAEARHRTRVLNSVRDYLGSRNRTRHG